MTTKWNLLGDRVIIEPDAAKEKTEKGFYIPVDAQEKPPEGTVIMVGPGFDGVKPIVQVGDRVSYGKHAGVTVEIDKKEYLMMRELEIFMYERP